MAQINQKLDLNNIPKLVGKSASATFKKCYSVLDNTRWPLYIVGPSGSGKSIIAMNLAKKYSIENDVPAYYVQLSPEQTKTSLILGLRLVKGNLEAVNGVVAQCMEEGGIIIVDEATHSTQEILLMFNSILDRTSVTAVGDKIVSASESFRIVFCSNTSTYAGNVKLPQSFAQRLVTFYFDYPTREDEIKITKSIADDECLVKIDTPKEVVSYITALVREYRSETFPLSVRNGSIATVLLSLADKKDTGLDKYFVSGSNVESVRRNIAKRVFGQETRDVSILNGPEMGKFCKYISMVGVEEFKEIVLQSMMYYLDLEQNIFDDNIKKVMKASII